MPIMRIHDCTTYAGNDLIFYSLDSVCSTSTALWLHPSTNMSSNYDTKIALLFVHCVFEGVKNICRVWCVCLSVYCGLSYCTCA